MLLPLVAYDLHGGRLGMGAGWYDRTLAAHSQRPLRVGVGWALQRHERLPMDDWDQPLHAVLNEKGWFTCDV
jgi:5-formyltetrahydrofolate cyclo-ligase